MRSLFFFALLPLAAWSQTSPTRELTLTAGKGELLQFERDVNKVVVAEPKIADAVVVSPHEVMINARGPGRPL